MNLYLPSKHMLKCLDQVRAVLFSPRMVKIDHLKAEAAIARGVFEAKDYRDVFRSSEPGYVLLASGINFRNGDASVHFDALVRALVALKHLGVHSGVASTAACGDLSILADDVADMTVTHVTDGIAGGRRFKISCNAAGESVSLVVPPRASTAITAAARRLAA